MESYHHSDRAAFVAMVTFAVVLPAIVSAGESPTVDRFFPPGGQIGTTVEAEIKGKPGESPLQVWSDRNELEINVTDDRTSATVIIPDSAKPGLHWLRFYNEFGTTELRPFITGIVPDVAEKEPNNRPDEASLLGSPAVTVNGVLQSTGDVDVYRVDVPAGRTLVASMVAHRQLGSPMDAVLQLLDSHGTVVAQNDDDHGTDPFVAFHVPSDGTWYLRTFAFPSTPNSTIRLAGGPTYVYRLTVTSGPFVDHTQPAVIARRGTADVTIHGWNLSTKKLHVALPWGQEREIVLLEDFAAAHPVLFVDHASCVEDEKSRSLQPDVCLTGHIAEPGEIDAYTLTAATGQQLHISVSARSFHSLLDPVLKVTAADGKVLAETDDRGRSDLDGEVSIAVPDENPLTITVTDRYQAGGWRYFYLLTCEKPHPEVTATVSATHFTLNDKDTLEIPVTIVRKHGFDKPVTISVEGLPNGVTVESQLSEAKGDSAGSVRLSLNRNASANAFSGVIRIVCSTAAAKPSYASATVSGSKARIVDLWLTVRPQESLEP